MSFCLSVCMFHCFLKKDNNLPLGYLGVIILVFQMHKIISTLVSLPKGTVLGYFCTFIYIFTSLCSSFPWDPLNYYFVSLKSHFHNISSSAVNHYEVCWGSFWAIFLYFSRAIPSYYINFVQLCFALLWPSMGKENFEAFISLLVGILQCFLTYCGYFRHALRNTRHVVVSLLWTFMGAFGPFCNMFLKW